MTTLIADDFPAIAARMREIAAGDVPVTALTVVTQRALVPVPRWQPDAALKTELRRLAYSDVVPPPGRAFLRAGCRCNLCLRAQGICICPTCTERRFSDSDYARPDGRSVGRFARDRLWDLALYDLASDRQRTAAANIRPVESMWVLPDGYKPATS